ncbi:MAG: sigma-54-dependent Fis family transcriptional regulator [Planctomycetes bacterium]|nr:sigma-54-dependent Fis family transcriptional regulator [Planctomycetota bacterium]
MNRVLIVDDDAGMGDMLESALGRRGYEVSSCRSADEALDFLAQHTVQAVVTDLRMKGLDGIQLCERLVANYPNLPVVVMTAFGTMDAAIAAIRAGAADFLAKPFKPDGLALVLERVIEHRKLVEEVSLLRERLETHQTFETIIGNSPSIRDLCEVLSRVARTSANVLITGETGTGKELVAHAIHERSARAKGPFVAINCAAVPEALLESELFGHAQGAFTDARRARAGLLLHARGGTVFLDEVGDMPAPLQAKLLRVLQDGRVRPVGSDHELEIDARVLSATHKDLEQLVAAGTFREDLYYRLNVVNLAVPPLRERGNDVLLLAQHFLERFSRENDKPVSGISSEAARRLLEYQWPGNVRELSNSIERAVALTQHDHLIVDDLPPKLRNYTPPNTPGAPPPQDPEALPTLAELERQHVLRVLEAVEWNKARAARILGLDRKTLYRRLEQYGSDG